jgi:hypothetical protein
LSEDASATEEGSQSRVWIERLIAAHADEIDEREIIVRVEFDPRFQMMRDEPLQRALTALLRFAFSTVPDRCEIFIASTRKLASVSTLESGSLTLRWQAAGTRSLRSHGSVAAIRPIIGGAQVHVVSRAAQRLFGAFHDADWDLELCAMNGDREIWARAGTRGGNRAADPS